MTAAAGRADDLLDALRPLVRGLRIGGACANAHVAADAEDGDVVWYCEEWLTVTSFEQHLRSADLARLLAVMEVAAQEPVVECRLITETRGLDYIAAIREGLAGRIDAGSHH